MRDLFRLEFPLGGSCLVISGVIIPLIWVITIVTLLITPLITTHEPPSRYAGRTKPDVQGWLPGLPGSAPTWRVHG